MEMIISEKAVNSLLENTSKYRLPNEIYNHLAKHFTSLGNNKAFPDEEKYSFDYQIIKERYEEIVNRLDELKIQFNDLDELRSMLSRLMTDCIRKEKPIRDILNKLCEKTVKGILYMPQETILFRCLLVDKVEPKKMPRIMPEDDYDNEYTFNDVEEKYLTNDVVMKRRFINSLVQGASYSLYQQSKNSFMDEIFRMDDELPKMYEAIVAINDFLLFQQEIKYKDKDNKFTAHVDVTLGSNGKKTKIEAQAILFPFLLIESFRGCCELFAAHGLPKEDVKKLKYIISKADYKTAEQWDMRFGVKLWQMLSKGIEDAVVIPNFISELSSMETSEFYSCVKEMLSNTKKGNEWHDELLSYCYQNVTYDDMPQDVTQTSDNMRAVISDDTQDDSFTIEELSNMNADDFFLKEYKGEQLVLPFDGSSHAYSDMQYIDYLQHNSVGKTLTTQYKNPQDYFNSLNDDEIFELFECTFYCGDDGSGFNYDKLNNFAVQIADKYPNIFNDEVIDREHVIPDIEIDSWHPQSKMFDNDIDSLSELMKISNDPQLLKKIIVEEAKKCFSLFIKNALTITENGLIYVERGIGIPNILSNKLDNYGDVQYYDYLNDYYEGNVGNCWAYRKDCGEAYDNSIRNSTEIILQGYTRCEDVNWVQTFAQDDYGESELTLNTDGLVEITNIYTRSRGKKVNLKANYPFVVRA